MPLLPHPNRHPPPRPPPPHHHLRNRLQRPTRILKPQRPAPPPQHRPHADQIPRIPHPHHHRPLPLPLRPDHHNRLDELLQTRHERAAVIAQHEHDRVGAPQKRRVRAGQAGAERVWHVPDAEGRVQGVKGAAERLEGVGGGGGAEGGDGRCEEEEEGGGGEGGEGREGGGGGGENGGGGAVGGAGEGGVGGEERGKEIGGRGLQRALPGEESGF